MYCLIGDIVYTIHGISTVDVGFKSLLMGDANLRNTKEITFPAPDVFFFLI